MASPGTPRRGRVLGAAKTTSPVLPPSPSPSSAPAIPDVRINGLQSPSGSSVSLESQASTRKTSFEDSDISSAIALGPANSLVAASGTSRMVCPICNEEMVTLLQLNRHLDDTHRNLETVQQDEVKNWFKTQIVKARRFQPLAVINQKLKGLETFESNEDTRPAITSTASSQFAPVTPSSPSASSVPDLPPRLVDADEIVTREHWQRYSPNNACSDPLCGKRLGGSNGNINCRKCGKLFCDEHIMYQMKLSRSAQHEPIRGFWCRVCETCYKSREGYLDHSGAQRDCMASFASARRKAMDASLLEVTRLEKRISKLTQILSDVSLQEDRSVVGYFRSLSGTRNQKRLLEQSVVNWEDDATVQQCPFCQQEFSGYAFRRHHCRVCGRVVCADLTTKCSREVPLDITPGPISPTEKTQPQISLNIRMCKDCYHIVFRRSDFVREISLETPDQRAFQNLKQFELGIRTMLPRFQKLLIALQDPDKPPTSSQLMDATKVRKRLTDSFTQYSIAATRIRDLPSTSSTQLRLQKSVHAQASSFLHVHMLPLKSLPKILKHASPSSVLSITPDGHLAPSTNGSPRGRLAVIRTDSGNRSADGSSSALSSLETEEKELRERLIVLEEQKFMVGEMVADAQRRRKFEEVESLSRNLEDLGKEIDNVQSQLGSLDFEGAYIEAGLVGTGSGIIK